MCQIGLIGWLTFVNAISLDLFFSLFFVFFRSTPKSQPNNLYMGLRMSVRKSVHPQKVFPISMKFGM